MLRHSVLAPDGSPVEGFRFDGAAVTYEGSEPVDAGVRVERVLPATDDPGWLVPGVFYGENRPAANTRLYPRFTPGHVDLERMESDAWSFRADRCATPAVFARGGGLLTSEQSPVGQAGVGLADRDGHPVVRLHFPYREEPLTYDGSETAAAAVARTYAWHAGERIELAFGVHDGDEPERLLRELHGRGGDPGWVGVEEAASLAAHGLHRWHYRGDPARLIET